MITNKHAILSLFFIAFFSLILLTACDSSVSENNKDMDELNYMIVYVTLNEIRLWDHNTRNSRPQYIYDGSNETIKCPFLCFGNEKLIFAKNIIAENKGYLVLINLDKGNEEVLYKGKAIRSPVLSPNEKFIAFLSDFEDEKGYFLFLLDLSSMKITQIINKHVVHGGGYSTNISWDTDNKSLYFSDINGQVYLINIETRKKWLLFKGYDPICSPDGEKILFRKSKNKPYKPFILTLSNSKTKEIKISKVINAIWTPESKNLLIVRYVSSFFSWNEWGREVSKFNLSSGKRQVIFKFQGFEFLDCNISEK